jgi:predicted  nucleic acid-binding Zn-ribbon protein
MSGFGHHNPQGGDLASQSKIKAARERYEALLATTQQEFDVLKERQAALTEHMAAVKGRLKDIQLALDAFTPEPEESAPSSTRARAAAICEGWT